MPRREGAGERSRRFRPCPRAGRGRSPFEAAGGTRTDGQSREVDRGISRISAFLMLRRPGRRRHRRAGHPRAACRGARPQDVAPRAPCSRQPRPPASRPAASRSPRPSASCRAPTPRPAPAPFPFGALGVSQRVRVHVISHVTSGGDVDRLPVPGVVAARAQRVVDEATPGLALADPGVEVPEADRGLDTGSPAREVVSSCGSASRSKSCSGSRAQRVYVHPPRRSATGGACDPSAAHSVATGPSRRPPRSSGTGLSPVIRGRTPGRSTSARSHGVARRSPVETGLRSGPGVRPGAAIVGRMREAPSRKLVSHHSPRSPGMPPGSLGKATIAPGALKPGRDGLGDADGARGPYRVDGGRRAEGGGRRLARPRRPAIRPARRPSGRLW